MHVLLVTLASEDNILGVVLRLQDNLIYSLIKDHNRIQSLNGIIRVQHAEVEYIS